MPANFEKDELVYKGRVLEVHRVTVRTRDGNLLDRDLVHYNGAAVILPVLEDGRMVLIRNYRYVVGAAIYELPAGNLDVGEDPQACALRELTEETGYQANRLEKLGAFLAAPGTSDEVLHAFLATGLRAGRQELEGFEDITVELCPQDRVRAMVLSGEIHDAKTIATLGLYWMRPALGQAMGAGSHGHP
jgi:ADP-ribose pyrophosphatase